MVVNGWGQGVVLSEAMWYLNCNVQIAKGVMVGLENKGVEWTAFQRMSTVGL